MRIIITDTPDNGGRFLERVNKEGSIEEFWVLKPRTELTDIHVIQEFKTSKDFREWRDMYGVILPTGEIMRK